MQLHHHSRLKLLKNNRRCVERVEVRARSSCEQRLARWLEENGGLVSGVILDEDRQVRATELLEPGRCLVSVPRACQVRYDDVHDEAMLDLFRRVPQGSSSESAGAWQFKQALTVRISMHFIVVMFSSRFCPMATCSSCYTSPRAQTRPSIRISPSSPAWRMGHRHLA